MADLDFAPTDLMCRRTALPLCARFVVSGIPIAIHTNCLSLLSAAGKLWFVPGSDTNYPPATKWEIVGTPGGALGANWECEVTHSNHSLYLSMGPEQWFGLDLETLDGAGFFLIHDPHADGDRNAEKYLTSIALNLGASMRVDLEKNCRD